jgi:hypothetical protein
VGEKYVSGLSWTAFSDILCGLTSLFPQAQKVVAGSREAWLKLCKQAKHRNLKFDEWMAIKDQDNNIADLPAHLR